uniref:Telomere repeat binding bouquet formation protein 2 n=1 Tax=Malurus cyaneus samueli TaxID=2593467 RepID=A0A8C5U9L2_9PASS
ILYGKRSCGVSFRLNQFLPAMCSPLETTLFLSSSIHESLSYLEGRATVFHSRYLSAWAGTRAGEKPSVVLGHFVLPPACLQEEIRRKIGQFIWERADALEEQMEQRPRAPFPSAGYASARDMKKYEGELHDFIPGTLGYMAYWVHPKFSIYCEKSKMKRKLEGSGGWSSKSFNLRAAR